MTNALLLRRRGMMPQGLPDGRLAWIETDGDGYFDTGVLGDSPRSVEMKILAVEGANAQQFIGASISSCNCILVNQYATNTLGLSNKTANNGGHYGGIDISNSVANATPVELRTSIGNNNTNGVKIQVKQEGDSYYQSLQYGQNFDTTTNLSLFLFATNGNGSANRKCEKGARIYYCNIYNSIDWSNRIKQYQPWRLNGVVGLMDIVSNTFIAPIGGTMVGGPNI